MKSRALCESNPRIEKFAEVATKSGNAIVLYLADCIVGMAGLERDSVDVVVTSPPYNIGVAYGAYNDKIPRKDYLEWIKEWGNEVRRVLSPKGSLFLNVGSKPSDPWGPFDVAGQLRDDMVLQNVFHWIKSIYVDHESYGRRVTLNVGHFKPINSKRFVTDTHEYIFHFTKKGDVELDRLAIGAPYKDESNITRWRGASGAVRCRGNSWFIPYKTILRREKDRPHPASYPPALAEMCLKLHGLDKIGLVLDPFVGIGSTAVACLKLDVAMIGFEIDPEYLKTAADSLCVQMKLF
jgi:site-specific DNA-methyltransferase (adenine-specific)